MKPFEVTLREVDGELMLDIPAAVGDTLGLTAESMLDVTAAGGLLVGELVALHPHPPASPVLPPPKGEGD